MKDDTYFCSSKNQKPPVVNKHHPWRLCNDTFWSIHLISNSKRSGNIWGANQVPALYLDQNLLSQHSHVNNQIGWGVVDMVPDTFYASTWGPVAPPRPCRPRRTKTSAGHQSGGAEVMKERGGIFDSTQKKNMMAPRDGNRQISHSLREIFALFVLPAVRQKSIEDGHPACGDQNGRVFPISARAGDETASILQTTGKIIRVQAPGKKITRKKFSHSRQFNDPFFSTRFETAPVTNVLSRPEEVHGTSAIRPVFGPFPKRNRGVPHQTFRFGTLD